MDQGKELIKLAVFGRPVKTSLSPSIHRMFADQLGFDIDYQAIETGANGFRDALEAFRLDGGSGCNITVPLKREAWQVAAESSPRVALSQAANTLVNRSSGWFADNTDGAGLRADLTANNGVDLANRRILILGAGGATAGTLGSLLAGNPAEVVLVNRDLERARQLARRFASQGNVSITGWDELSRQGKFELVINATSLGHQGKAPPLVPEVFSPGAVCYDLNYYKAGLPLMKLCKSMGQRYIDGLGMLVEQAAKSFEIWTGKRPDSKAVIEKQRLTNRESS